MASNTDKTFEQNLTDSASMAWSSVCNPYTYAMALTFDLISSRFSQQDTAKSASEKTAEQAQEKMGPPKPDKIKSYDPADIEIIEHGTVDGNPYNADVRIGDKVYKNAASTYSNPYKIDKITGEIINAEDAFGNLDKGLFRFKVKAYYNDPSMLAFHINNGNVLPSVWGNINHAGQSIVDHIWGHIGYSSTWRGSHGCITFDPAQFANIMSNFNEGQTGLIRIVK